MDSMATAVTIPCLFRSIYIFCSVIGGKQGERNTNVSVVSLKTLSLDWLLVTILKVSEMDFSCKAI
jgi:hypothetical protein